MAHIRSRHPLHPLSGLVNENSADPRSAAAIRIPRLNWTLHGYYAYYYQPPPLDSLRARAGVRHRTRRMASFRCRASATSSTISA